MHIVKVCYEAAAFDVRLTRGGTATMVWGLAKRYADAGHRVSILTPAHGQADYLCARYGAVEFGSPDAYEFPLVLDPALWTAHPPESSLPVATRAYLVSREGVELYFLSNEYLDLLPQTLYPTNEMQGHDLAFVKPQVFQADALRFIDQYLGEQLAVVQCYEPGYHYLLPPALSARAGKTTVSTVVVNTRIDDAVYRPQIDRLLRWFGVDVDLDRFAVRERDDVLSTAMRDYLRPSHLARDPGRDYVNYFGMVASYVDLLDFVSPGQRDYYCTFRDAPFESRFQTLGVAQVVRQSARKHFVGGCALPDWWLERDPGQVDRTEVLAGLGLAPNRPTFYHAARLAHNHKGQLELFRAIDEVLRTDSEINFVVRCAVAAASTASEMIGDPFMQAVADRYPGNVYLDWRMVDEEILFEHCAASDFCLFPSKFELDGFLITMAEAMACAAVPIATAQETLSHYQHHRDLTDPKATGFAVPRSFRTDDPTLSRTLAEQITQAVRIFRDEPALYTRLSRNCVELARTFTWDQSAALRLAHFARAQRQEPLDYPYELAIEYGWFDQLDEGAWRSYRDRILAAALSIGDADAYARCAEFGPDTALQLFDAAYRRADFVRCESLAGLVDRDRLRALRDRCRVIADGDGGHLVSYAHPGVERVDLIVAAAHSIGVGSGNRHTYPLARAVSTVDLPAAIRSAEEGATLVAPLPPEMVGMSLVFLLTLQTGRIAWDLATDPLVDS